MYSLIICGESNAGKTTTCRKLLKTLIVFDAKVESYQEDRAGDFFALTLLEGHRIAICSAGDEKSFLRAAVKFGEDHSAEVLVCALSHGKHYSDVLKDYKTGRDYFRMELPRAEELTEKSTNENHLLVKVINKLYALILGEPTEETTTGE